MLLWTLLRHRGQDSFADNPFFYVVLPAFLAAKLLVLDQPHFHAGVTMAIGLYRMAFLLMLERTLTQFMKGLFQVEVLRKPWLDGAIKLLGLALVFQAWLPVLPAALLLGLLAALLAVRFVGWRPDLGFTRIDLAVMFLGYWPSSPSCWSRPPACSAGVWVGSVSRICSPSA
jgi:uncharacterized protein involved in response to NO